jgi:hypothetical protein
MFARRWRLRRMASHKGRDARCGGIRGLVGPYIVQCPNRDSIASKNLAPKQCGGRRRDSHLVSPVVRGVVAGSQ